MKRIELRVDVSDAVPWPGSELAVTLVMPDDDRSGPRTLALAFPGGGYARGYWDIQCPGLDGYSQAEHHAQRGWVFAAIDHLGVGESSHPEPGELTLEVLAAANSAASRGLVEGLRTGALVDGLASVEIGQTIGMGQSMGGCLTIVAQGAHAPFDAIAVLGFSAHHTVLPSPDGGVEIEHVERGNTAESTLARTSVDLNRRDVFAWAFHWDDVEPTLLEADLGSGYPARTGTPPPWGSNTVPPSAVAMLSPGVVSQEAAAIAAPVFVGVGERDVVPDPWSEPSAYRASRDITLVVVPRMAHMHNFAGTRRQLWERLQAWGDALSAAPAGANRATDGSEGF